MTDTTQNIPRDGDSRFVAGDTAVIEDTITEDDGTAKNITGADIEFALADYPGASPHVTKDNNDSDVTITDATGGVVEITLQPSDTNSLGTATGYDYYYEIAVRDSNGSEATVTTGTWCIYANTATF